MNKSIQEELKSLLNDAKNKVNKEIHHYSGAEAWRDVKKTAVVTSTAVFTVLCCFAGGE
tara:strand:- start:390 stop:566 length:177 start_codon:yes stop_codon:yes gene_type:complete